MSTCAAASRRDQEPLAGTAATADTWLLVEQPGPWGRDALTQSHLDPDLGTELQRLTEGTGIRLALIRRYGPHADHHDGARRRLFLAHTHPGRSWVRTTEVHGQPHELAALTPRDYQALGRGDHLDLWEPYEGEPLALVCTNGKRDRCCALLGRPLAAELLSAGVGGVWEITHIGGHRFAPTLLVLPFGYAYGRASAPVIKEALVLAAEGRVLTEGCRGRSAWERPGQAADLAVRRLTGEDREHALTVLGATEEEPGHWRVEVAHHDGGQWAVTVRATPSASDAPASCGAAPGLPDRVEVEGVLTHA
ncbi:sucrase ferredoxin [Streptomyces sp. NPDC005438]|uniref:sucrase ferredoxin n=1 Tax=Streptomyces sp. NPDC005438 TaxID=3156880 RepID=UPI0033B0269C